MFSSGSGSSVYLLLVTYFLSPLRTWGWAPRWSGSTGEDIGEGDVGVTAEEVDAPLSY